MKKLTLFIACISILFLVGCSININVNTTPEDPAPTPEEQEFNDSGQAKAIKDETDLWQFYENQEAGFSVKFPHDISFRGNETDGFNLVINERRIDSMTEEPLNYTKENALSDQESLKNGDYGNGVDWPVEVSKKVKNLGLVNAQDFMVLGRFEICDVVFQRKLVFYHNDHLIDFTFSGPMEQIRASMPESFEYHEENCGTMMIWKGDEKARFYNKLASEQGSEFAQEWFDTFDEIVETIEFR